MHPYLREWIRACVRSLRKHRNKPANRPTFGGESECRPTYRRILRSRETLQAGLHDGREGRRPGGPDGHGPQTQGDETICAPTSGELSQLNKEAQEQRKKGGGRDSLYNIPGKAPPRSRSSGLPIRASPPFSQISTGPLPSSPITLSTDSALSGHDALRGHPDPARRPPQSPTRRRTAGSPGSCGWPMPCSSSSTSPRMPRSRWNSSSTRSAGGTSGRKSRGTGRRRVLVKRTLAAASKKDLPGLPGIPALGGLQGPTRWWPSRA